MKRILILGLLFCGIVFAHRASAAPCWPEPGKISVTWSGWEVENYKWADVPASAGATRPYVGWFIDACTKKETAILFNGGEAAAVVEQWVKGKFIGSNQINAWIATQGVTPVTLEDSLFLKAFFAARRPKYVVPASSTGSSPAYTLNADQSRNTKAIAGVRVPAGTVCDGDKRLGTTNYYFVPNIGGTVGLYVNCVLKK